ncbi:unnamed protein product [Mesocestoides corti]|uniref:Uncharacterized protein n=1 Tax=Mesocestoides corti TaxID=53468 RepID=A0A0R3U1K9_MESCO|nr:unnamed protein product [Mesocestoides corti]
MDSQETELNLPSGKSRKYVFEATANGSRNNDSKSTNHFGLSRARLRPLFRCIVAGGQLRSATKIQLLRTTALHGTDSSGSAWSSGSAPSRLCRYGGAAAGAIWPRADSTPVHAHLHARTHAPTTHTRIHSHAPMIDWERPCSVSHILGSPAFVYALVRACPRNFNQLAS